MARYGTTILAFFYFLLMDSLCASVGSKQVTNTEPPSGECSFNYCFPVNAIAISVQVRMCTRVTSGHAARQARERLHAVIGSVKLNYVMTDRDHYKYAVERHAGYLLKS